jgi:hypothetical protein
VRQQLNLKCGRYGDSEILPLSQLTTDHLGAAVAAANTIKSYLNKAETTGAARSKS